MKVSAPKRSSKLDSHLYCDRCYIRLGSGERHLFREGKTYHYACYVKMKEATAARRVPA